ncbi:MAG: hypothetical protein H6838_01105 [Planctomycetes bacterium]|nr:hypothetical protein [Planctomycetota bacterium]MCB9884054.1 hypothetical protein [Planctomycetota bacterium]
MTDTRIVPAAAPIVGVRLHSRSGATGDADRVQWLLSLAEREQARQQERDAVLALCKAVEAKVQELPGTVNNRIDEIAGIAVELGLAVAREIVGNALDTGLVDPTPTVARCLRDCVHGSRDDDLVVRLHPDDLQLVTSRLQQMPELTDEVAATRFVADATVARGAVRAETEAGRLRYDPREALERVSEEVRREVTS